MEGKDMVILINKFSSHIVAYVNKSLIDDHITFQQLSSLIFLKGENRPLVEKDLCQYLGISHPTAVGIIGRMYLKGLIEMHDNPKDRRSQLITIGYNGERILEKYRMVMDDVRNKFEKNLSEDEFDQLFHMLMTLDKEFIND